VTITFEGQITGMIKKKKRLAKNNNNKACTSLFLPMATDQVEAFLTQVPLVSDDEASCLKGALNIARILRADQCCYRCVLRFLGCTSFYLYAYEDKVQQNKKKKKSKPWIYY
jgi:hypothetical protein